ncbi:MAG TPA: DHHA1 domain-containing protein [Gemmatimonadales bacterium]|nr:DHHA1 domain-containing protein [Gemmatimonadales bacterium]
MTATTRLYYTDAYCAGFDARLVALEDEGRRAYLDHTAFYPTSGGQPADRGTLAGVPVVDVVDEGERIAHVLAEPLTGLAARTGAELHGLIDWARRFDHMQQHTGQHLLSALFADLYGMATTSVHFGAESSTIDLGTERLEPEQTLAVETRANAIVLEHRPVTVSFEAADAVEGLRKASRRAGELRIVTIAAIDRNACGGTHVRTTAEIGPVLLRGVERAKRQVRVEFLCGWRALRAARADHELLQRASLALSAAPEEVPPRVGALLEQLRESQRRLERLEREARARQARERWAAVPPDADGVRRILERRAATDAGGAAELRELAQAMAALERTVFVGIAGEPAAIVVGASEDSGVEAGSALRAALEAAGGRGGGSPRLAQGSVPSAERLPPLLDALGPRLGFVAPLAPDRMTKS